jgi:hypothetical protein
MLARSIDASGALAIETLRPLPRPIAFDVTASFIGRHIRMPRRRGRHAPSTR